MKARALIATALLSILAACASGPETPKPTPLETYAPQLSGHVVWSQHLDGIQFPLSIGVSTGVFTVAGNDGTVLALETDSGREVWRGSAGAPIAAGVGTDGRFVAVVTRDGELVMLEAGRVLWRKSLSMRVTTTPLVAGERVFVLGSDRSVQAFDAQDGTRLWSVRRPSDPLTLAQGGVIAPFKDTLLAGQGARLAGLDPKNGDVRWEVVVGSPRGTNEVERLADLVAPWARVGDLVCVRSFQAAVGCVNAERGTLSWSKPTGGTDGVSADEQFVFAADASDRLTAWKTATGEMAWQSDRLLYRGLTAPLAMPKAVVFGDREGVVHFLSRDKGETLVRMATDGSPIASAPVASAGTVLVVTRQGGVFAIRAE